MKLRRTIIVLFLLLFCWICPVIADIIYVNGAATGSNNGTSWANAYVFLQDALDTAVSGDQIWVAAGIYKPTSPYDLDLSGNRDFHFRMKNNVEIYGGFPNTGNPIWSNRDPSAYETILSGDIGVSADSGDNCYHVFYHPLEIELDITAALDGFTITGGNASDPEWPHYSGGGMFNECAGPTVVNCTFIDNTALYGGGMENFISDPTIADCTFINNTAEGDEADTPAGGAISNEYCNPAIMGCTFTGNVADYGAGMDNYYSNPLISKCTFTSNTAVYGGGMENMSSSPFVTDCIFSNNTASGNADSAGGGMSNFLEDGSNVVSNPTVTSCVFSGNSATYGAGMENEYRNPIVMGCVFSDNTAEDGGGMYSFYSTPIVTACTFNGNSASFGGGMSNEDSNSIVVNCIFSGNSALSYGGGMENYSNCNSTITNCTFSANNSDYGGGMDNYMSNPTLNNSIFWNNTATSSGGIYNESSAPVIAYSNIQGGLPTGSINGGGNIDTDPLFLDEDGLDDIYGTADDNLKLRGGSFCIDAGSNTTVPVDVTTDLDGQPRIINDVVDMGAYESDDPCLGRDRADFDCNGIVNMVDLVYLASRWLQ